MAGTIPTKVVLHNVRFSFAHVFEPTRLDENSAAKYSVSVIIDKDNTDDLARVKAAVKAAIALGKAKTFGGKIPKRLKTPLRDGDEERDDESYEGVMFLNANSTSKPGVVDENLNPIIDPDEFYSGCYGRVSINFYPYNKNGSVGIAAGLNNVQKLRDGERLAGGSSAAEDFGAFTSTDDDDMM